MKALIKKKSQLGKIIIPKLAGTAKLTKNISLKNVGMPQILKLPLPKKEDIVRVSKDIYSNCKSCLSLKYTYNKYPKLITSTAAAGMYGVGDYLCQIGIEGSKNGKWYVPDFERLQKMITIGFLVAAPVSHTVYRIINPWYLSKVIPVVFKKFTRNFTQIKKTLTSIFVDCFIVTWPAKFAILFSIALYGTGFNVMESVETGTRQLIPAFLADAWFYPFYKFAMYQLLPEKIRPFVSLVKGTFMSIIYTYIAHNK